MHNYIALKIDGQECGIESVEWVFNTIEQLTKCCSQKELAKIDRSLEPLLGNCCHLPPHEYYRVPIHFIREMTKINGMLCRFSGSNIKNAEESFLPLGPPGSSKYYNQIFTYHVKLTLTSAAPDAAFMQDSPHVMFVNLRTHHIYQTQFAYQEQLINVSRPEKREIV